jgi:hypothetical protein
MVVVWTRKLFMCGLYYSIMIIMSIYLVFL